MNLLAQLAKIAQDASRCARKVRYGREKTALKACQQMAAKGSPGLSVYYCAGCLGYHIGHK